MLIVSCFLRLGSAGSLRSESLTGFSQGVGGAVVISRFTWGNIYFLTHSLMVQSLTGWWVEGLRSLADGWPEASLNSLPGWPLHQGWRMRRARENKDRERERVPASKMEVNLL